MCAIRWEIFTGGAEVYAGIGVWDLPQHVIGGARSVGLSAVMSQPGGFSFFSRQLCFCVWYRPDIASVVQYLEKAVAHKDDDGSLHGVAHSPCQLKKASKCTTTASELSSVTRCCSSSSTAQRIANSIERMWATTPLERPSFYEIVQVFSVLCGVWCGHAGSAESGITC